MTTIPKPKRQKKKDIMDMVCLCHDRVNIGKVCELHGTVYHVTHLPKAVLR